MLEELKDKYIFFDFDGTLCEYRAYGRIYCGFENEIGYRTLGDLLYGDEVLKARPLKNMQEFISKRDINKNFVLGAITTSHEAEQKIEWLKINFPNIKKENIIFIKSTMLKPEVIAQWCRHFNIDLKDVAFVDDRIEVLRKAELMGISSYHPSSFVE